LGDGAVEVSKIRYNKTAIKTFDENSILAFFKAQGISKDRNS
jgi:hypothetical protein